MSKVVAVCGATGKQGSGVVDALLKLGGFKVRGLTRDPASKAAQALAVKGVEVRRSPPPPPPILQKPSATPMYHEAFWAAGPLRMAYSPWSVGQRRSAALKQR